MRRGLFGKLAVQNIRNNRSTYIPYMLTCIFCIAMMYMMEFLRDCPTLEKAVPQASEVRLIVGTGEVVVGIFCVIFLIYSNSFLAKRRKKEFGLFQILGMEKKHLAKILFFESLYLWAASLGIGILLGVLLYRLLFLVLMKLTGLNGTIGFAFSAKAVGSTMLLFGLTFVINFLLSLRQIHVSQPVELLHGCLLYTSPSPRDTR